MTTRADQLRAAIIAMVTRYGASSMDFAMAVARARPDDAEWHARAKSRRFCAIQRLTRALANLSGGAR